MPEALSGCPGCEKGGELYGRQFYRNSFECGCAGFPEESIEENPKISDEGVGIQNGTRYELSYSEPMDDFQTKWRQVTVGLFRMREIVGKFVNYAHWYYELCKHYAQCIVHDFAPQIYG